MKTFTEIKQDSESGDWWVELGMRSEGYTEMSTVETGKTREAAIRKAARALRREADKLEKQLGQR